MRAIDKSGAMWYCWRCCWFPIADGLSGLPQKDKSAEEAASWWLRDVNVNIKEGQLACIVGRVGSGKRYALVAHMSCTRHSVVRPGTVPVVSEYAGCEHTESSAEATLMIVQLPGVCLARGNGALVGPCCAGWPPGVRRAAGLDHQ